MAAALNGINRLADQVFIGGLVGGLSKFARHGPANLMLLIFKPYWELSGLSDPEQEAAKEKLYRQVEAGVLPVSIMGLFAMAYFGLLFLL